MVSALQDKNRCSNKKPRARCVIQLFFFPKLFNAQVWARVRPCCYCLIELFQTSIRSKELHHENVKFNLATSPSLNGIHVVSFKRFYLNPDWRVSNHKIHFVSIFSLLWILEVCEMITMLKKYILNFGILHFITCFSVIFLHAKARVQVFDLPVYSIWH